MFAPGEYWSYDNTGYYLWGFILEKVSGKPYEDLLREFIFAPLKMDSTVMNQPYSIVKNRVAGYYIENNTLYNKEYYSPSNTFFCRWLVVICERSGKVGSCAMWRDDFK